jgi:hypothetical protein
MKKIISAGVFVTAIALAGLFAFHTISAQEAAVESGAPSKQAAQSLQTKIDNIKKADAAGRPHTLVEVQVTETELESYVLFELRDSIPAQLDALDVQLTPGAVAADTQLTFNSNATGNPLFDALVGGTHNLFVKGKLSGAEGLGRFDLDEVRVDGIPVPKVLIYTLVDKYVKPKYPDVDMKAPFELPWSIRSIDIQSGKARIGY